MFIVIITDVALVLIGGIILKKLRVVKENKTKEVIIFTVIVISAIILWLNYKFIDSTYWWIISVIFILSMFVDYLRPSGTEKENSIQDNYRGD